MFSGIRRWFSGEYVKYSYYNNQQLQNLYIYIYIYIIIIIIIIL